MGHSFGGYALPRCFYAPDIGVSGVVSYFFVGRRIQPKPEVYFTTNHRASAICIQPDSGFFVGFCVALFCAGVVWVIHSLQSPVHSTDFSIVGNPNRSNCPAACVASAFLALAQN